MKTKTHQRYRSSIQFQKNGKGLILPGVTTIIDSNLGWNKRILMAWAKNQAMAGHDPDKVLTDAGDTGTCAHHMIECHITGEEVDLSDFTKNQIDRAENGFLGFLEWEKQNKPMYLDTEIEVISEKYLYGGTCDIVAQIKDEMWMIDLKTSKGIYPEFIIQLAAYSHAHHELIGTEINKFCLLHLNKETGVFTPHMIAAEQITAGWRAFTYLRELHKLKKELN